MVTTHLGDLKTYAFNHGCRERRRRVRPRDSRAHVSFARRRRRSVESAQDRASVEASRAVVERAEAYLAERLSRGAPDWEVLEKLRREAAVARQAAVEAQAEAERTREALTLRLAQLHQESSAPRPWPTRER